MKNRPIYVRAISFSHFEVTSVLRLRGATCCKQDLVTAQTPIFVTINTLLLRPHPGRLDNQKMYDKPHTFGPTIGPTSGLHQYNPPPPYSLITQDDTNLTYHTKFVPATCLLFENTFTSVLLRCRLWTCVVQFSRHYKVWSQVIFPHTAFHTILLQSQVNFSHPLFFLTIIHPPPCPRTFL